MKEQSRSIFKAGSYIYIEGDEDVEAVYIVEKGLVEFKSVKQGISTAGNTAGPGDVFGVISALCCRPRMETAFAKANSSIITFSRDKFLSVLQKNSTIAIKLLNTYADDLRLYDTMIFPLGGSKEAFLPEESRMVSLGTYYYQEKSYQTSYYILKRYLELYPRGEERGEAEGMLAAIEKTGIKRVQEPVPEGIYRRYADRQIIFCEHEPGDELFIIKKGKVKIVKHHNDSEIILSVLKESDIFGELSIVSDKSRNASAFSYGTTVLLPVNKDALQRLIEKSSDILKRIFTAITQRVWFTYIRMESKFYEKPITRIYVFLENKLIEENISIKGSEPHTFNFGIDELIRMTSIPADRIPGVMEELSRDQNLNFLFGQTGIESPSAVSSKARYYRSRDRLLDAEERPEESAPAAQPERPPREEVPAPVAATDPNEDRKRPAEFEEGPTEPTGSSIFDELEDEISKSR